LPQAQADANEAEERVSPYGDQHIIAVSATKHVLVDEGSYVCSTNPTVSTGVAYGSGASQASFSDTVAFMVWYNGWSPNDPNARRMYLDYLRLIVGGTVPTGPTSVQCAIKIDNGNRAPTANSTLTTPVNANLSVGTVNGRHWVPNAGTITVPASVNARLIERFSIRHAIPVVADEYRINFGSIDGTAVSQSGIGFFKTNCVPVVLNPGDYCVFHLWFSGTATANPFTVEYVSTWWER